MTGILSVFMNTESSDIFVTACDMPYINAILIKHMVEKYNDKCDALIPLYDGKPQPLSASMRKVFRDQWSSE